MGLSHGTNPPGVGKNLPAISRLQTQIVPGYVVGLPLRKALNFCLQEKSPNRVLQLLPQLRLVFKEISDTFRIWHQITVSIHNRIRFFLFFVFFNILGLFPIYIGFKPQDLNIAKIIQKIPVR